MAAEPGRVCWVAGALGPTNKTASMSRDVNDPGARGVTFDELEAAYHEQALGLIDGGADLLLVETAFDTLNAKAALFAIEHAFDVRGVRRPVMASVTITDLSGRNLSGQTTAAFWISVSHAPLLSVGLNCALGPKEMRPHVEELSSLAPCFVSAYPNAGLPNAFGGFDETPGSMAEALGEWARAGFLNVVGGCCGTTPAHIRSIAAAVRGVPPRRRPEVPRLSRFSGLEPFVIREDSNFVNVGERTNVTGSPRFAKLVRAGRYAEALEVARQQVEGGAQILDVNMDEGLLDSAQAMHTFLNLLAAEPDIARVPIMLDSSDWRVLETGLKCLQGKGVVNSLSLKEGEDAFVERARLVRRYGAGAVIMAFDEEGQATSVERRVEILGRAYRILVEKVGFPPEDIVLDPERADRGHRHRGARRLRRRLHRDGAPAEGRAAVREGERRDLERLVLVPRQQPRARGDARGVPLPRDPGRPRHGDRQRRPARGLRGDPEGPPRARRGRAPQPAPRRDRALDRLRPDREGGRRRSRRRRTSGGGRASRSG